MARLIDAELLKQNCRITGGFSDNFVVVDLETLGRVIDQQPTVDAVEVVHGRWEMDGVYNRCSTCNRVTLMPHLKGLPQFDYCPNCGADMRGNCNE